MPVTIDGTSTAVLPNASGNVGIGTSTPAERLEVRGNAVCTNGVSAVGVYGNDGSIEITRSDGVPYIDFKSGLAEDYDCRIQQQSNGLVFFTGGNGSATERARINSDGYLVVNTTNQNLNVGGSWGRIASLSNADGVNAIKGASGSGTFFTSIYNAAVTRTANSGFSFLLAESNANVSTDYEFNLRGDGTGLCDGSWTGGGADYAEYFESATGAAIPVGTTVVLDGDKVRAATVDDPASTIIGVVRPKKNSAASAVIGNAAWNRWNGKYLTDDFGAYVMEDHDVIEWTDADGTEHSYESHAVPPGVIVPDDAVIRTHDDKGVRFQHRKLNPAFDPTVNYVPREDRAEWVVVGLVGQVAVSIGQPIGERWLKMSDRSETVAVYLIR